MNASAAVGVHIGAPRAEPPVQVSLRTAEHEPLAGQADEEQQPDGRPEPAATTRHDARSVAGDENDSRAHDDSPADQRPSRQQPAGGELRICRRPPDVSEGRDRLEPNGDQSDAKHGEGQPTPFLRQHGEHRGRGRRRDPDRHVHRHQDRHEMTHSNELERANQRHVHEGAGREGCNEVRHGNGEEQAQREP